MFAENFKRQLTGTRGRSGGRHKRGRASISIGSNWGNLNILS